MLNANNIPSDFRFMACLGTLWSVALQPSRLPEPPVASPSLTRLLRLPLSLHPPTAVLLSMPATQSSHRARASGPGTPAPLGSQAISTSGPGSMKGKVESGVATH